MGIDMLSPFGEIVWEDRYALKDGNGKLIEKNILETFRRVATAIASKEKDHIFWGDEFYEIMAEKYFCPAGRVLAHSGTHYSQLLNCFVLPFQTDSLEEIMNTAKNMAVVQKLGGGTGFNFSKLRPSGSYIKGVNGRSCGTPGFTSMLSVISEIIEQGGCLTNDTLLNTKDGLLYFEELIKETEQGWYDQDLTLKTKDGDKNSKKYYVNGFSDILKVNTDLGIKIKGTLSHKIYVFTEKGFEWKELKDIRVDDYVVSKMNQHEGQLQYLNTSVEKDHHNCLVPKRFPDRIDKKFAFFLGYYLGNGFSGKNERDYRNGVSIPEESYLSDEIENIFKDIFGDNITVTDMQKPDDQSKTYYITNKIIKKFLKINGLLKSKSITATLPRKIRCSSREVIGSFLSGLFEADGSLCHGYPQLSTSSYKLADEVQIILLGLGIPCKSFKASKSENRFSEKDMYCVKVISFKGLEAWNELVSPDERSRFKFCREFKPDLNREKNYVLPYAEYWLKDTLDDLCQLDKTPEISYLKKSLRRYIRGDRTLTLSAYYRLSKIDFIKKLTPINDFLFSKVTSIKFDEDYTSDMEVKKSHSYIANSLVSHNSRRGANLGLLEVWHPDIWEFISYKTEHNWECLREFVDVNDFEKWESFKYENLYKWQMFNVSVGITDEFLEAVKNGNEWPLKWQDKEWFLYTVMFKKHVGQKSYKCKSFDVTANCDETAIWKVKKKIPYPTSSDIFEVIWKRRVTASEIWDRICYNAWADGCPGIINLTTARKMHNLEYVFPIDSTNPCFTGDCKIETVDGSVTFESLDGKEVDIVTPFASIERGQIWKIGIKSTIKLNFNDNSSITVTPEQLFMSQEGAEIQAKDCLNKYIKGSEMPLLVISIENNGKQVVYDFSVPGKWGIVNGVTVHNCGEQPIPSMSSCNLSSLLLPNFVVIDTKSIDFEKLREVVHTAVRFSDNVIDNCIFPIPEIEEKALKERRIGLGTMGVHDMLIKMGLGYDTDLGRDTVEEVLTFIRDEAYKASIEIAKEKGAFPAFKKRKFLKSGFIKTLPQDIRKLIDEFGIRNGALLSQAPTGSISALLNFSSGCEPLFALAFVRNTLLGSYQDGCEAFIEWRKENPDSSIPPYFKTATEITPEDHVKMLILFSKYVDSAVSKTVNLPNSATVDIVKDTFIYAMENGVKGMTVFREGSKEGVLVSNKKEEKKGPYTKTLENVKKAEQVIEKVKLQKEIKIEKVDEIIPVMKKEDHFENVMSPKKRGEKTVGATYRVPMQNHNIYVTVNRNKDGELVEIFATVGESKKANTQHTSGVEDSWAEGLGKMISLALRAGVKPSSIIRNLKNIPSDKPVFATIGDNENSEHIPSPPHAIARVIEEELLEGEENGGNNNGENCKECGSTNLRMKSPTCSECIDCGFSGCG